MLPTPRVGSRQDYKIKCRFVNRIFPQNLHNQAISPLQTANEAKNIQNMRQSAFFELTFPQLLLKSWFIGGYEYEIQYKFGIFDQDVLALHSGGCGPVYHWMFYGFSG